MVAVPTGKTGAATFFLRLFHPPLKIDDKDIGIAVNPHRRERDANARSHGEVCIPQLEVPVGSR